ncbi:MAG TPA: helix-turn-helix domain-containing protein [Candidatus Mediterraneibacter norfolkensis]|nr:helix-turn-helix domain-containing protein [Candidatus Mediterraneibacter norfolkensis]
MTQIKFAKRTGISQSTVSDWRRKGTNLSADNFSFFGTGIDNLYCLATIISSVNTIGWRMAWVSSCGSRKKWKSFVSEDNTGRNTRKKVSFWIRMPMMIISFSLCAESAYPANRWPI